ncbi:MAG: cyclic nucleotide-binding domain-containing protein [Candidatus Omnitrophica bacterium]|nr:cyclic nucleotide-binding domain-containing protein [Candidatus Omnitrophota bacterium]
MTSYEPARPQDKVLMLRRVPVFAACTDEQLQLIADRTRLVEYKKGEHIYNQGDPAAAFYIVSSGRLRIFTSNGAGERTIAILHNGDAFGEVSLLTGEMHSATAQAVNDTLVLQLEKKDFDDVINRIPSLVLYLSRLLSKRLRTKEHGMEESEATIVGIHSASRGVGRTCFAMALAASLTRETDQAAVIVDFATHPQASLPASFAEAPEDALNTMIATHPLGFSVLCAEELISHARGEQLIAPLLNLLTRRFQYILLDLPLEINPPALKALVQSDLIYLMTDADREHVLRANALVHQLETVMSGVEQRIKVVVNRAARDSESLSDVTELLGKPPAFTLPFVEAFAGGLNMEELARVLDNRQSAYTMTVRYLARELGGLLVGLALGSGAALGLAHIGVLKVLEREKIPIDVVAGSSIGGMVAGLWASGRSADELEQMATRFSNKWDVRMLFLFDMGIPWFATIIGVGAGLLMGWWAGLWAGLLFGFMICLLLGIVLGPLVGGPIQGARLMERLRSDFAGKTFADTWLPVKIVASNPMAREEIVFESGSLVDAVRASVSIPGIFKPVTYKGKVCLDGGVVNPVPVSVLKKAGCHHIIAVNVFPTTPELTAHLLALQHRRAERDAHFASRSLPVRLWLRLRQELIRSMSPLVFDIIMRSMQSMEYQISELSCREADITLRPTVPGSHWLEFASPAKFIQRGEEVALQQLPALKRITRMRGVDKA